MILALKTAGDITELVLLDKAGERLEEKNWESGRQLGEELLGQILELLGSHHLTDLSALIVFRGPGSFTSLRIGIATLNALSYALAIPIAGSEGDDWLNVGLKSLSQESKPQIITPLYDRGPNVTQPKK